MPISPTVPHLGGNHSRVPNPPRCENAGKSDNTEFLQHYLLSKAESIVWWTRSAHGANDPKLRLDYLHFPPKTIFFAANHMNINLKAWNVTTLHFICAVSSYVDYYTIIYICIQPIIQSIELG